MREGKGGAGSAAVPGGSPWRPGLAGGRCPSYSRRGTWIKGSAGTGPGQPTSSSSAPTEAGCSSPASTATVSWGRGAISPARRRRPPAPWQRRLRSGPVHTLRAERAAAAAGPARTPSLRHAGAWRAHPLPPSLSSMAGRGRAGRAGGGSAGPLSRAPPSSPPRAGGGRLGGAGARARRRPVSRACGERRGRASLLRGPRRAGPSPQSGCDGWARTLLLMGPRSGFDGDVQQLCVIGRVALAARPLWTCGRVTCHPRDCHVTVTCHPRVTGSRVAHMTAT